MRYNKLELFALASQTSQNFDREGVLILKERQEGFFRRSEGCSVRWFRLRGNLLFYLKGPEPWYEPLGVIVLGNHKVTVQTQDENGHWPFQIVWDNGVCYRMATFLEAERMLWLDAMELAPIERMTQHIAELQQQLEDTRKTIDLRKYRATNKIMSKFNDVPICELSLSCDNLLCDANGHPPTPFAAVFLMLPKDGLCVHYCHTEAVERCSNPSFCRTVMFRYSDKLTSDSLIRIVVYNIRESLTQTGVAIGAVTMPLGHIQEAQRLRVPLLTVGDRTVGFVTITGWSLEPSHAGASPTHPNIERNLIDLTPRIPSHRRSQSLPTRLGLKLKYPTYPGLICQNFMNPNQATYRFQSGLGGDITVHETIAEARFCFTIPMQLVEIYMNREKELLEALLAFAEVSKRVVPNEPEEKNASPSAKKLYKASKKAQELFSAHLTVMKIYRNAKKGMYDYTTDFCKRSTQKVIELPEDAELGFVPINLHLQRIWAHNDTINKSGFHDIITVGAFSAHSHHADKPGGLIRLVQHSKDISTQRAEMMANTNRLEAEFEKLHAMKAIRNVVLANMERAILLLQACTLIDNKELIKDIPKDVVMFDQEGRNMQMSSVVQGIRDNVSQLLDLWNEEAVEETLSRTGWNKKRLDEEEEELRVAEELARQAQRAASPQGAARAAAPEGAEGEDGAADASEMTLAQEAAAVASALHSVSISAPDVSAALEAALEDPDGIAAAEDAKIALAAVVEPASSSSSCITTPTADTACALSASVPDMHKDELGVQNDQIKSENSPRSDRSEASASGQSERSGKSNQSGKSNRSGKNNRGGRYFKKNRDDKNSWHRSFRTNRDVKPKMPEDAPPPLERQGSLRADSSSASLEQVSHKADVNNKKADVDNKKVEVNNKKADVNNKKPDVNNKKAAVNNKKAAVNNKKVDVNNKKAEKKKAKKANRFNRDTTPPRIEVIDPAIRRYNLNFFKDVTTAIEDMLFNVVVGLHDIFTKGSYTAQELEDTRVLMDLLIKLLDEAYKWTRMALTALRIESECPVWTLQNAALQSRRDTCFSQALTSAAAGLMSWLTTQPEEVVAKVIQTGLGPLCGFEGLLSLYALEKTMWGDMVVAIEDLHTVLFKLVKVTSSTSLIPQVTGQRNAVIVELPVMEPLYSRFEHCRNGPTFTVTAVFFNIGINEKATVAAALNECRPQHFSNNDNLERLLKYYHKYTKVFPTDPMQPFRASSRSKPLEEVMENLRTAVNRRAAKDVEVLHLAALATRLMHGIRFTSCKSAKDRTGMAVTLEQVTILSSEYHLAEHDRKKALDVMRSEGCRRENTMKNIGMSKYAFSKNQVTYLPEDYRPPVGSYGTSFT